MLGPFTFTFTLESEEYEKFENVGAAADLYQTLINTRDPDGANNKVDYIPHKWERAQCTCPGCVGQYQQSGINYVIVITFEISRACNPVKIHM